LRYARLANKAKSIDWRAYLKGIDVAGTSRIVVTNPDFFAGLDALRAKFKPAAWEAYFTAHALRGAAFGLPQPFDDAVFELQHALTGIASQPERAKRCVEETSVALGELLGQAYANKYFPASARQTASGYIDAISRALTDELGKLEWMSDPTRQLAQAKLAKIVRQIGSPEHPRGYDFEIKRDDFGGNHLRSRTFELRHDMMRVGKPVDRSEWRDAWAFTVDAFYDPATNTTTLPAGILKPPFFGPGRSVAANLGAIGSLIGHEIIHGFDDTGALYDGDGNLKDWWHGDDKAKFDAKASCVADQYGSFEPVKGVHVNGKLTLGEDIADLGGVKMAFYAYRQLRKGSAQHYAADGFGEDQQFFLSYAQMWCSKERPESEQLRLTADEHAPAKFRVFGALRNLPEFAAAFGCAPGTPMRPANACTVW